jgi:hypothetical protein
MSDSLSNEEIHNRFTYHKPEGDQPARYEKLREKAKELAFLIRDLCPDSRERASAMTHLETSVFWANASIARNKAVQPLMESDPVPGSCFK